MTGRSWKGNSRGWVERLLGEMQQQDIPGMASRHQGGTARPCFETDKRGLILSMIHKFDGIERDANTRDNILCFHRRGAPLRRQRPGNLPDGGAAELHHHRVHRNANSQDRPRRKARSRFLVPTTTWPTWTSTPSPSQSRTRPRCPSATPWRPAR